MTEVFIYFHGQHGRGLDELEDFIEDALGELGEVTGTGAGDAGSNIDVEVLGDDAADEVVLRIKRVLQELELLSMARIEVVKSDDEGPGDGL